MNNENPTPIGDIRLITFNKIVYALNQDNSISMMIQSDTKEYFIDIDSDAIEYGFIYEKTIDDRLNPTRKCNELELIHIANCIKRFNLLPVKRKL